MLNDYYKCEATECIRKAPDHVYCQNGKVVLRDPVALDTDGNCPNHLSYWNDEMWACGDGTCVIKDHLCNYNLAPLCPDYSDLLYCRNRTAEKKERGCYGGTASNAYGCLDRSIYRDDSGLDSEESRKRETEKRTIPNSPPNCTGKNTDGYQLYPCTGYYPNTCGIKDICSTDRLRGFVCDDYSSFTCLSKSKAEGCRDIKEWAGLPYFQCNKSGYYETNQIIIHNI